MSVSGRIEDFSVVDVMQYVHASRKSGTLYFQRGREEGRVYFHDGHIVRAVRPGVKNIGDWLMDQGHISRVDLQSAVSLQESMEDHRPLGMILEEMGVITHETLRSAVVGQIREVVYDLATWDEGEFRFELGECDLPDDISVSPFKLIPLEEIDTQEILVEAMRVFESSPKEEGEDLLGEMQQKWEEAVEAGSGSDPACRGSQDMGAGAYYASGMSLFLLQELLTEARKNGQGRSISLHFLRILAESLERAIIFLVRENELLGVGAIGETEAKRSLNEMIKNVRVSLEAMSVPARCVGERAFFHGVPPAEPWLVFLYRQIGSPISPEVVLLPVAGVERVVGLVYGDNGPVDEPIRNLELLEVAAGIAGMIFENVSLRKQARAFTQ